MSIVKMKHLRLLAMQYDRDELLQALQDLGCVEIDQPAADPADPAWAALTRPEDSGLADARRRREEGERALAILSRYTKEKGGLLQPRPALTREQLLDPDLLAQGEKVTRAVLNTRRAQAQLEAQLAKLEAERTLLAPWLALDVPLEMQGTQTVLAQLGTLPASVELSQAEGSLLAVTELACLLSAGSDAQYHYLLLLCHASAQEEALQALKELGWSRFAPRGYTGAAAENDAALARKCAQIRLELDEIEEQFCLMAEKRADVQFAVDRAAVDLDREQGRARLRDTEQTFYLEGWLPADSVGALDTALSRFPCAWEAADPAADEVPQVPVKLKNNALTRCMNVVTNMYSLPAYDGVDPNPLMFPFFVLFFGIMMADMGYGLLMIAASLLILRRGRPRENTRNFMEGVLWCGVSTFIVGALTGGFFGDFIPQLARIVNPESTFEMPALFTPLNDTVSIMLGSLVLGVIQVLTGMTVSVVKKIREGDFVDALFDEITWWIILGGIALAVLGIGTVSGVPVVLAIGCAMLVFGGTRKAKGFGKLTSLVGLIYNGVTGFFSDILSYVRLMALMLSGSVIAQVFNTLGATFGNVILFVLISMVGNALNLALNLLGCYVHDLRLQCLEFFNRFYKEGGRPYAPLSYQTKYIDVVKS